MQTITPSEYRRCVSNFYDAKREQFSQIAHKFSERVRKQVTQDLEGFYLEQGSMDYKEMLGPLTQAEYLAIMDILGFEISMEPFSTKHLWPPHLKIAKTSLIEFLD